MDEISKTNGILKDDSLKRGLIVTLLFSALAVLATYPLIINFSKIPGWPGDVYQFIWNQWWFHKAVIRLGTNPMHCSDMFHPYGVSLAVHTFAPLRAALGAILLPWFGSVFAYNILFLLSFVLSGCGMYALARFLGFSFGASILAGVYFSFIPFRMFNSLGHMNLFTVECLPWTLYWAIRAVRNHSWRAGLLTGVMFACTGYCGLNLLLYTCLVVLILAGTEFIGKDWRSKLTPVLACGLMFIVLFAPMLWELIAVFIEEGVEVLHLHPMIGSVDVICYLLPAQFHPFWYGAGAEFVSNKIGCMHYVPISLGWSGLLLLIIGTYFAVRLPGYRRILLLGLISGILCLGLSLRVAGSTWLEGSVFPFQWWLNTPFLGAAREPGRFAIPISLCVALLAALATDRLRRRISGISYIAAIIVMLEFLMVPFPLIDITPPKVFDVMLRDPVPGAVLQLPCGNVDTLQLLYQTYHDRPILSGKLSRMPESLIRAYREDPILGYLQELQDSRLVIDFIPAIVFRILGSPDSDGHVTLLQLPHGFVLEGHLDNKVINQDMLLHGNRITFDGLVALDSSEMTLTPLPGAQIRIQNSTGDLICSAVEPDAPWESRASLFRQPKRSTDRRPSRLECRSTINKLEIRYILLTPGYRGSQAEQFLLESLSLRLVAEEDMFRLFRVMNL